MAAPRTLTGWSSRSRPTSSIKSSAAARIWARCGRTLMVTGAPLRASPRISTSALAIRERSLRERSCAARSSSSGLVAGSVPWASCSSRRLRLHRARKRTARLGRVPAASPGRESNAGTGKMPLGMSASFGSRGIPAIVPSGRPRAYGYEHRFARQRRPIRPPWRGTLWRPPCGGAGRVVPSAAHHRVIRGSDRGGDHGPAG
jgi:hypothetical protein